jgi:hypothetical protein
VKIQSHASVIQLIQLKGSVETLADLGSPNERCGGPSIGEDGEPNGKGPNGLLLGNALIVQEPGATCPDDNVDSGIIEY